MVPYTALHPAGQHNNNEDQQASDSAGVTHSPWTHPAMIDLVDVIEEGVDGEIPAQGVLLCCAKFHGRDAAVLCIPAGTCASMLVMMHYEDRACKELSSFQLTGAAYAGLPYNNAGRVTATTPMQQHSRLRSQVHQVNPQPINLHARCLQMLGLIWVGLNDGCSVHLQPQQWKVAC